MDGCRAGRRSRSALIRTHTPDAGVIDQQGDAGIGSQGVSDPCQIRLVVEIGREGLDRPTSFVGEALRQTVKALAVARHQDQVVVTMGQAVSDTKGLDEPFDHRLVDPSIGLNLSGNGRASARTYVGLHGHTLAPR